MYGWLKYDPTDQQPPSGSVDGIHILYASTVVPGENDLPTAALAVRAKAAANFINTVCKPDPAAARTRIQKDLMEIIRHVPDNTLEFSMYMCRAHHLLPDGVRQQRTATIDRIMERQLGDVANPGALLLTRMAQAKTLAILIPDVMVDGQLRRMCANWRAYMSVGEKGMAPVPHLARLPMVLAMANKIAIVLGLPDPATVSVTVSNLLLTRPHSELDTCTKLVLDVLQSSRVDVMAETVTQLKGAFSDLPPIHALDAWERILRDALAGDAPSSRSEIVLPHLHRARYEHASQEGQLFRTTVDALRSGVDMGPMAMASNGIVMAHVAQSTLAVQQRMTPARAEAERAARAPSELTSPAQEKPDLETMQAWSLDQLVSWIDGPVTGPSAKPVDRSGIVGQSRRVQGGPRITPGKPAPSPVKGQTLTPSTNVPVQTPLSLKDVDGMVLDALSATARFFLDDIQDLLALATPLKAEPALQADCQALVKPLFVLANHPSQLTEAEARKLLTTAEQSVARMRLGLQKAQATAQVQRRFQGQLALALRAEALVMGKRHGGVIQCPARPSDWSHVVAHFHNRWLPSMAGITVDGTPMPLDSSRALALYVTGSSQSGYAFDVSVHLWRRRAGRTSPPSSEAGEYPLMNTTDWFDTLVPCCVLHVPQAH